VNDLVKFLRTRVAGVRQRLWLRRLARGGTVRTRNTLSLTSEVPGDGSVTFVSLGRSTTIRRGESPAEAMNRLTEGHDL
jgi:hypothetical protein